jgi:hypothetical protein
MSNGSPPPPPGSPPPDAWPAPAYSPGGNIPISALPPGVALAGPEWVPLVQGGVTVRVPASFFPQLLNPGVLLLPPAMAQNQTLLSGPAPGFAWIPTSFNALPLVASWNGQQGNVTMVAADVTGALGFTPYSASNPSNFQTGAQVAAIVNAAVPTGSTTIPLMDGTGSAGTGTTYSRGNHVHPTDTSLVPLAGGAMTGYLLLNNDPLVALGAVTKQYVDVHSGGSPQRFVGSFDASASTIAWSPGSGETGNALPPPVTANSGWYIICNNPGTNPPSGAPAGTYTAGDWLISDGTAWSHLLLGSAGVLASAVAVIPAVAGASDVQTALTTLNANQANYLPLGGGTLTGPLDLAADPTVPLGAATKQYVDAHTFPPTPGEGVVYVSATAPATPVDGGLWWASDIGQLFMRYNDGNSDQWVAANNAPGVPVPFADAPSDGNLYGRENAGWTVVPAVPAASTTLPIMDGTAAVGAGTSWARNNHVHPSDTSRLPTAGGTLSGNLGVGGAPTTLAQAGTAIDFATLGQIITGLGTNGGLNLTYNAAYDGTNWRYVGSAVASLIGLNQGGMSFLTAPSGAAGAVATFATGFTVDVSGNGSFIGQLAVGNGLLFTNYHPGALLQFGWDGSGLRLQAGGSDYGYIPFTFSFNATGYYAALSWGFYATGGYAVANFAGTGYSWPVTVSDRRLKSGLKPATLDALAILNQLQVYDADLASPIADQPSKHWDCALIADELEPLIPQAYMKGQAASEGQPEIYDNINTLPLVCTLIKAVQQLTTQNAALTSRIAALEAR